MNCFPQIKVELNPEIVKLVTGEYSSHELQFKEDGTLYLDTGDKEKDFIFTKEESEGKADYSDLEKIKESEYSKLQKKLHRVSIANKMIYIVISILTLMAFIVLLWKGGILAWPPG